MSLLPVAEAQARILALAAVLPVERAALSKASARWLAEPLIALRDQPWADLSAMDGYAIREADLPGPWTVSGESRAGGTPPSAPLGAREAMRIFTGAPLPDGADCILIQEEAAREGDRLTLTGDPPSCGHHVRAKGSDFRTDAMLLPVGTKLGPAGLALAATAGHGTLAVRRRPRVALISTGDELVPAGAPCPPGKLPSSNAVMLAAMLESEGAEVVDLGLVPDDLAALTAAFADAAARADIVVSTGGASVGDHDLVGPAIVAAGGALDFWKIAMRPGKPLMAGTIGPAVMMGLPGNPVSAFVTAMLFLLPLVRHCAGAPDPLPRFGDVPSGVALPPGGSRAEYLRGRVEGGRVVTIVSRDSAALGALASADALIERPIDAPAVAPGEIVRALAIGPVGFA